MRICVFGAGAIGGFLAHGLAGAGVEVSLVARGPHLAAIRAFGLRLRRDGAETVVRVPASDDPADLGPQDHVIIALKAHSVPAVAGRLAPLLGPATSVVTASNGVPWWYFAGHKGPFEGHRIEAVDPGGVQWRRIGPERAIGCAIYPACTVPEPGVIEHLEGDRFTLGEPSGERSARVGALSEALRAAGFRAPVKTRIRDEIWVKLWGNVAFNPLSALTGATLDVLCADAGIRAIARAMMVEAQEVGEALGARFGITVDRRIDGAAGVGAHKTSMLQDLEGGRPMEIDALVTAVQELGRLVGVPTPEIDRVLTLVVMQARQAGCYDGVMASARPVQVPAD